jgi:hypothetical protein
MHLPGLAGAVRQLGGTVCKRLTVSDLGGTLFPASAASAGAGRQRVSSSAWLYACPA